MATPIRIIRVLALLSAFALLLGGFFGVARPWHLRWGATDEEVRRWLPGDDLLPRVTSQATRAVTIDAPIEQVWPWLAQLGQNRGGFYSFDLLENAVGSEMPTDDRLRPDRQAWEIGDKLWMYPRHKAGGARFATLRRYVPGRALVFGAHAIGTPISAPEDASWALVLEPIDRGSTRLLVRGRSAAARSPVGVAFDRSIFEPVHFVMLRRMMAGIEQLAERSDRQRLANHAQVGLWAITLGLFGAAIALTMRREAWYRPLFGFVAAGVVFQVLTLAQPPIAVGLLLVAAVIAILWPPKTGAGVLNPAIVGERA